MSFLSLVGPGIDIEVNGKTYKISPLSFNEMAEYIQWYQWKEFEEAKLHAKDLPPEMKDRKLEEAYEKCRTKRYTFVEDTTGETKQEPLSWETPEVQESQSTVDGIAYQLYLSLKINHPEIKLSNVSKIVTLQTYKEIFDKILVINGLSPEDDFEKDDDEALDEKKVNSQ